ncbi:MAG: nitroreductase family deazaflavin-dependent oxidoreductase [Actinomycetota bacterium]|nr:nitroreductase family deazaflavin-dependent oxidoreductase [Actinomycetota bacterium]
MANLKDLMAKNGTKLHQALFDATKGRVGGRGGGMPVVKLTTTGRKSGQKRTTMLTSPLQEDDKIVLIASYGGDDRHPAWYLNLRDNPDVEATMTGSSKEMRARTASAEEKADMWPKIVSMYKGYAGYQEKTDRDIPVVILEPR